MRSVQNLKKDEEASTEVIPGSRTNTDKSLRCEMACLVRGTIDNLGW